MLHGTHPLSDTMVQEAIKRGMRKVNQNRNVRHGYDDFLQENAGKMDLTKLQTEGVEIYSRGIERLMRVMGSDGKS